MKAVAPFWTAASTPSAKGKKASEATTVPATGSTAFVAPSLTESTRLIWPAPTPDRKSTRLNSSHANISYAVFCLKKDKHKQRKIRHIHNERAVGHSTSSRHQR